MKCKNCGAELDEGALFCRKCGTAAPAVPEKPEKKASFGAALSNLLKNRRLLLCLAGAVLLVVLIVVIVCASSCGKKTTHYDTPEAVFDAAICALEAGDGETLYEMTTLSEPLLGAHPETFGEGDFPEAVMRGYYDRLASGFRTRITEQFGENAVPVAQMTTETHTGSEIYETNRALGLEAEEYRSANVTFTVDGEPAANAEVYLVAVGLDGEWKLLVVYLY